MVGNQHVVQRRNVGIGSPPGDDRHLKGTGMIFFRQRTNPAEIFDQCFADPAIEILPLAAAGALVVVVEGIFRFIVTVTDDIGILGQGPECLGKKFFAFRPPDIAQWLGPAFGLAGFRRSIRFAVGASPQHDDQCEFGEARIAAILLQRLHDMGIAGVVRIVRHPDGAEKCTVDAAFVQCRIKVGKPITGFGLTPGKIENPDRKDFFATEFHGRQRRNRFFSDIRGQSRGSDQDDRHD
ncbi:hypothetical protein SDC9_121928 [bioreactor metagenome]|uniref:Uncharacterized protein n=1 Tax=bioreactor metagenome TaxID=1076179 RepID=A0A645CDB8_9ZZZZ